MSTWDDKPNDYDHAVAWALEERAKAARFAAADRANGSSKSRGQRQSGVRQLWQIQSSKFGFAYHDAPGRMMAALSRMAFAATFGGEASSACLP